MDIDFVGSILWGVFRGTLDVWDWLDRTLRRVTWHTRRSDDGPQVEVDAECTARRHRQREVAEALTHSLPEGQSRADALPAAAPELPEGVERRPGSPDRPRLVVRSAESPACIWLAADAEGNRLLASYEDGSTALWQFRPVQLVHRFPPIGRSPRIALCGSLPSSGPSSIYLPPGDEEPRLRHNHSDTDNWEELIWNVLRADAERDFSGLVQRVCSEGVTIEVQRCERVIARITPVGDRPWGSDAIPLPMEVPGGTQ